MTPVAIAMDLGTSGIRAQSMLLSSRKVSSTVITTHHPLPGANVIDHLHFALELGVATAQAILVHAVNQVIRALGIPIDAVQQLAVCGNPTQLSIFQGIDIRDLAYAGKRKRAALNIAPVKRNAAILTAKRVSGLNLPSDCRIIIPPAIHQEVGADALAMIIKTRMLARKETSLAVDFGTNAEIALFHKGRVTTASTAAGPALEGQQISWGMLAAPGAISDVTPAPPFHHIMVLGPDMIPAKSDLIDLSQANTIDTNACHRPVGITGTGTIAMLQQGIDCGMVDPPRIYTNDGRLHAGKKIHLSETDIQAAGKAIGALRAGQLTLCHKIGIGPEDIRTVYMSGASGTYMDAAKAQLVGLIPPNVRNVFQVGNTSLAMARELISDAETLNRMSDLADRLRQTHCMLAGSKTFEKLFILELSHWTEGMPMTLYRQLLKRYGLPDLPPPSPGIKITRRVQCDIGPLGAMGLTTLPDPGMVKSIPVTGCTVCGQCATACPGQAIVIQSETKPVIINLNSARCNGVTCKKCERICPEKIFHCKDFFTNS